MYLLSTYYVAGFGDTVIKAHIVQALGESQVGIYMSRHAVVFQTSREHRHSRLPGTHSYLPPRLTHLCTAPGTHVHPQDELRRGTWIYSLMR